MPTAQEARESMIRVRSSRDRATRKQQKADERRIRREVRALRPGMKDAVLRSIKKRSDAGYSYDEFGVYVYGEESERVRLAAMQEVMGELSSAPYDYKVTQSSREGYNGEGNNMSDFYVYHSWTISWE